MLECPVCRQPYDGRNQIFVPPHRETFDTVACAQRAAEAWGWDTAAPVPVIEAIDARAQTPVASTTPRRGIAALAAVVLGPGHRALATGICLLAAGTAASIYLLVRTQSETAHVSAVAAGVPQSIARSRPPIRSSATVPARTRPVTTAAARPEKRAIHPQRPITAGVTYEASWFPLTLRITPPDDTWAGAQWQTRSHGRPAFGWVSVGRLHAGIPRGLIAIEAAFGRTPSVPAVVAGLRSAGAGVTYGKTTRATVAGYPGRQFEGKIFGSFGHVFVPFSPRAAGVSPPDSYKLDRGERFRIIVLDVRGESVALFLTSFGLPAKEFPAFLTAADQILGSLEFPG